MSRKEQLLEAWKRGGKKQANGVIVAAAGWPDGEVLSLSDIDLWRETFGEDFTQRINPDPLIGPEDAEVGDLYLYRNFEGKRKVMKELSP